MTKTKTKTKTNIEGSLRDILNVGIGLLRVSEENFQEGLKSIVNNFDEFKTKGANSKSENAESLRKLLDNSIKKINNLSHQAEENFNHIRSEIEKVYEKAEGQIRSLIGDERYTKLSKNIQQVQSATQVRAQEFQRNATEWVTHLKKQATQLTSH